MHTGNIREGNSELSIVRGEKRKMNGERREKLDQLLTEPMWSYVPMILYVLNRITPNI
jgi:hypothetical protein